MIVHRGGWARTDIGRTRPAPRHPGFLVLAAGLLVVSCGRPGAAAIEELEVPTGVVGRVVVFEAADCDLCAELDEELLAPLQTRCGPSLEVKRVAVDTPEGFEAFVATERALIGEAGRWDLPTIVVDELYLTGESAIRQELVPYLACVFAAGGNDWPQVSELTTIASSGGNPFASGEDAGLCLVDEDALTGGNAAICAAPSPLFVLAFAEPDCDDRCSRTRYDLRYLEGVYPQLVVDERDISEEGALAEAVGAKLGIPEAERSQTPMVIVGDDYLVGDAVTLEALREMLSAYAEDGAPAFWYAAPK